MLGVPERRLMTLLNFSIKDVKGKLDDRQGGPSSRSSCRSSSAASVGYINANYWTVLRGRRATDVGVGGVPLSAWVLHGRPRQRPVPDHPRCDRAVLRGRRTLIVRTWDNVADQDRRRPTVHHGHPRVNADAGAVKKTRRHRLPERLRHQLGIAHGRRERRLPRHLRHGRERGELRLRLRGLLLEPAVGPPNADHRQLAPVHPPVLLPRAAIRRRSSTRS